MSYAIKEVFVTLQGEGARAGARSVFVRFAGCNLWDGNPDHRDRGKGACAKWCDTDFAKGKPYTATELLTAMTTAWGSQPSEHNQPWCVLSGGEPALQVDRLLLDLLHDAGWLVAMETNGSLDPKDAEGPILEHVDWLTVSPKKGAPLVRLRGAELKVVLPGVAPGQDGWTDDELVAMGRDWQDNWDDNPRLYIQPQDPIDPSMVQVSHLHGNLGATEVGFYEANLARCIDFIHKHPEWRLSLQTHKYVNLP